MALLYIKDINVIYDYDVENIKSPTNYFSWVFTERVAYNQIVILVIQHQY